MQDDPGYARTAMRAGARGYVLKEAEDAELVQAVRTVAAGGTYLDPALGGQAARGRRRRRPGRADRRASARCSG